MAAGCITNSQKQLLIELVSSDGDLISSKFSATFTFAECRRRWQVISEQLNAMAGANKDYKHWRKTWQDLRSKAKLKDAYLRRHAAGTGGGPPAPAVSLNATDELILQVINPVLITGHTEVEGSEVNFDFSSLGGPQPVAGCSSWQSVEVPLLLGATPPLVEPPLVEPPTHEPPPAQTPRRTAASRRFTDSQNLSSTLLEQGERRLTNSTNFSNGMLAAMTRLTDAVESVSSQLILVVQLLEEIKAKSNP